MEECFQKSEGKSEGSFCIHCCNNYDETVVSVVMLIDRSAWNSERFIGGSYSYHKVGQSAADCDVLAKPVPNDTVSEAVS